ncbi:unnamed protein product [Prunus armeniaca]|uniref:Protein LURP-one-related 17 n=1 Tax=Prunus armeniaca TaxID=36596 RepID=A0A6J5XEV8_PRUAR|nr:unnamed protein product [Prunus armeniaca]
MKIVPFLKSLSRSVHNQEQHDQQDEQELNTVGACTTLTVWRKSLLISCKGFTVIDSNGDLFYRVDNYVGHPEEVVLMDASGKSVLTMRRRKKLSLVDSWFVHEGEVGDYCGTRTSKSSPTFCVRKNMNMLNANPNTLAYVLDEYRNVVAEIKRKEANIGGVSYGVEVFHLIVHPGFDAGFAMALVLVLDQLFS